MNDTTASTSYPLLLERLGEAGSASISPERSADALRRGLDTGGDRWEIAWQDRLRASARDLGFQARDAWLSPAEILGTLSPRTPAAAFRRSERNPSGWTLLCDRRWGRAFRADLAGGDEDEWVTLEELCEILDCEPDTRMPWVLVDPIVQDSEHKPGGPKRSPLQRLIDLVRPDRADLWSVVVFAVFTGGLTLATPVAVQQLVNSVALGGLLQPVVVLAILLFASLGFSAVLSAIQAYVVEIVQRRLFVRVTSDLANRLPRVDVRAFDGGHGPELVNRFFDVVTVQKVGASLLLDGVTLLLQAVIGLLVLAFYHPLMLAFGAVLLLGIGIVVFVLGRGAITTAIAESKAKYQVAGWLEELARHAIDLKTEGANRFAQQRADDLARGYLNARSSHYRLVFRQLVGALGLQVIASAALLGLGGALVINGQLTIGQLVASELIVTAIVASFAKLGKHLEGFYDLLAAVDKLGQLFDLPVERCDGAVYDGREGGAELAFHDVSFGYGDGKVVDRLSFRIGAGEKVALFGASGAGKSTILDLVLGLRTPNDGYITLDDMDLRQLRLDSVREKVVRVSGPEIIEGTLEDNVRMGRSYVTGRDVRNALAPVGMLDRALRLPEGLRCRLATDGTPLSESEGMRVALARAIAGSPRLILLDGSFVSDLDDETMRAATDMLFAPDAPWTVLLATSREEQASLCERRIELTPTGAPDSEEQVTR